MIHKKFISDNIYTLSAIRLTLRLPLKSHHETIVYERVSNLWKVNIYRRVECVVDEPAGAR